LIEVCDNVFYVETFSSRVVETIFGLSNGADIVVANATFNQTFLPQSNPPPSKSADLYIIPIVLPQASEVQLLLTAFQQAKDKAREVPLWLAQKCIATNCAYRSKACVARSLCNSRATCF